jgi:protein-S-isoprenylcysteine O-methyltransferase Ste14
MNIKGIEQLRSHLPGLNSWSGLIGLFGIPVLLFLFVTVFFSTEDITWPFWWLDGEIVIGTIGFILLTLFFRSKSEFKTRFGPQAYAKAVQRFVFPGLAIIFAVVARFGYIPGPEIPRFLWFPVMPILGWLLIVIGAALWLRAVQTLGVDALAMLYVYHPEESRMVDQSIYRIVRHPVYGAALRIAFGLALVNGTWFGLTCSLVFALGLWTWVRLVEEKELHERFGSEYVDYRKRVPAFWPRWRDLGGFVTFLISGR